MFTIQCDMPEDNLEKKRVYDKWTGAKEEKNEGQVHLPVHMLCVRPSALP